MHGYTIKTKGGTVVHLDCGKPLTKADLEVLREELDALIKSGKPLPPTGTDGPKPTQRKGGAKR